MCWRVAQDPASSPTWQLLALRAHVRAKRNLGRFFRSVAIAPGHPRRALKARELSSLTAEIAWLRRELEQAERAPRASKEVLVAAAEIDLQRPPQCQSTRSESKMSSRPSCTDSRGGRGARATTVEAKMSALVELKRAGADSSDDLQLQPSSSDGLATEPVLRSRTMVSSQEPAQTDPWMSVKARVGAFPGSCLLGMDGRTVGGQGRVVSSIMRGIWRRSPPTGRTSGRA